MVHGIDGPPVGLEHLLSLKCIHVMICAKRHGSGPAYPTGALECAFWDAVEAHPNRPYFHFAHF
ncbi:hypothetical protein E2562_020799 [Oryza meyeriana var. granulata]|uniref:Uncharacterized protein n=1 Tax=Oryza meyeriana var. granulata TaxID=110450 RepID=A0A6G1CHT3_9ORYZ|nr:hypothetical protein E2562_020799 [Oryza meyeriana var. granulata]